jgi:uncharacterized protein affecting Mg2+/Co2+ transport
MRELNIGSTIQFGSYEWRVLDIQGNSTLVMTETMVGQQPYNNFAGGVTWADCSLRKYLNGEFYHTFSEEEKGRIIPVWNKNQGNHWYDSNGGEDTNDFIFLLSMEEVVCKYFGDSSKNLENRSAKQRYWFQKKDVNNDKRRATLEGSGWWWWLRTPGRDNKRAVYIHGDGNIGIQGNGTFHYSSNTIHPLTGDNSGGVRPVLWLSLEL